MKKVSLAQSMFALGCFLSLPVCAQSWYAGIDVGVNTTKINDARFDSPGAGLVGGWYVNDIVALETVVSASRDSRSYSEFDSGTLDSSSSKFTIEGRRVGLKVSLKYDFAKGFYTYLKPGVSYSSTVIKLKGNDNGSDFSERDSSHTIHPTLAAGVGYKFNDKISAVLGYERLFKDVKVGDERFSSNAFSAGLRYSF